MNLKQVWQAMEKQARLNSVKLIGHFNNIKLENPDGVEERYRLFKENAFDTFKECFEEQILKDMFDVSKYLDDDLPDAEDAFIRELRMEDIK